MITSSVLADDVKELRDALSRSSFEIPSFWSCVWPGLSILIWNVMCAYFNLKGPVHSVFDITPIVFYGVAGLMILLGTVNARTMLLSVPKNIRKQSVVYKFISKKFSIYAILYMTLVLSFTLYVRFFDKGFQFQEAFIILSTISFGVLLNLDLNRYQLSILWSVINAFKSQGRE